MLDIQSPLLKDIALVFNALGRGVGWVLSLAAVASAGATLSDVVGGSLLGVGFSLLIFGGAQWWDERR